MRPLTEFLTAAHEDRVFEGDHTSEQLLETLYARPNCTPSTQTFLRHSSMVALLNLTVTDLLAGRRSAERLASYGVSYYQQKSMDRPFASRFETVMREARFWDDLAERADAVVAGAKHGYGRYYQEALPQGEAIGKAIIG
jgi:hypothetical protein